MVDQEVRKRKLVHVIPFDDDASTVSAAPSGKCAKRTSTARSCTPLSSLEQDGLQALLTLRSPTRPLKEHVRSYQTDPFSQPPSEGDVLSVGALTPPFPERATTYTARNLAVLQKTPVGMPLLAPPPQHYLGRPLAPPPALPRIPYGCIFSNRKGSGSQSAL